jgi:hypothetical protein
MRPLLLISFLFLSSFAFSQNVTTSYNGNQNTGFGGAIGKGSVSITDSGDSISFKLTRGTGLFDDYLVIYLDGQSGGISSTSGFSASSTDPYYQAVTGANGSTGQRAVLNFPSNFQPEGAIVFNKDGGKVYAFTDFPPFGTFISEKNTFTITPSGTNSAPVYTQTSSKTDLGVSGGVTFNFIGTYISGNASRSNEAFGDPFSTYSRIGNLRSYNPYTISSFYTFSSAGALPVKLVDFNAGKERDYVNVNWSVAQETNIDQYEIQRSANGIQFATIQTIKAKNSPVATSYSIKDYSVNAGNNYYRLIISEKGKTELSKVVYINNFGGKASFSASYLPGNVLNISLNGLTADNYKLSVINGAGQLVQTAAIQHNGTNQNRTINLNGGLSKGIYRVVLQSSKEKFVSSILVQ